MVREEIGQSVQLGEGREIRCDIVEGRKGGNSITLNENPDIEETDAHSEEEHKCRKDVFPQESGLLGRAKIEEGGPELVLVREVVFLVYLCGGSDWFRTPGTPLVLVHRGHLLLYNVDVLRLHLCEKVCGGGNAGRSGGVIEMNGGACRMRSYSIAKWLVVTLRGNPLFFCNRM